MLEIEILGKYLNLLLKTEADKFQLKKIDDDLAICFFSKYLYYIPFNSIEKIIGNDGIFIKVDDGYIHIIGSKEILPQLRALQYLFI